MFRRGAGEQSIVADLKEDRETGRWNLSDSSHELVQEGIPRK
jgi:hypothetical protein